MPSVEPQATSPYEASASQGDYFFRVELTELEFKAIARTNTAKGNDPVENVAMELARMIADDLADRMEVVT